MQYNQQQLTDIIVNNLNPLVKPIKPSNVVLLPLTYHEPTNNELVIKLKITGNTSQDITSKHHIEITNDCYCFLVKGMYDLVYLTPIIPDKMKSFRDYTLRFGALLHNWFSTMLNQQYVDKALTNHRDRIDDDILTMIMASSASTILKDIFKSELQMQEGRHFDYLLFQDGALFTPKSILIQADSGKYSSVINHYDNESKSSLMYAIKTLPNGNFLSGKLSRNTFPHVFREQGYDILTHYYRGRLVITDLNNQIMIGRKEQCVEWFLKQKLFKELSESMAYLHSEPRNFSNRNNEFDIFIMERINDTASKYGYSVIWLPDTNAPIVKPVNIFDLSHDVQVSKDGSTFAVRYINCKSTFTGEQKYKIGNCARRKAVDFRIIADDRTLRIYRRS